MSGASGPLVAGGATLTFSCLEGAIIGTDQRSDSYTSGGGRTIVIDGSGGGSTSVATRVVVSRDIWIRDPAGAEHHVRVAEDIPVRVGQDVAFIYCKGETALKGGRLHQAGGLMSIYVVSTNKVYTVLSRPSLTSQLLEPPPRLLPLAGAFLMWVISVLLIAVFGIGFFLLAALSVRVYFRSRRRKARAQAITAELDAEHQRLIQAVYSSHKARLVSADTPISVGAQPKIAG